VRIEGGECLRLFIRHTLLTQTCKKTSTCLCKWPKISLLTRRIGISSGNFDHLKLFFLGVVYDVAKSFVEDILVRKLSRMGMGDQ
jgi:hypothetical protein